MNNTQPECVVEQASCPNSKLIGEPQSAGEQQTILPVIRHKIVVLSGKGGVGKSSVAANLSVALSRKGLNTGLLDTDLHGPSIPILLGIEGRYPAQNDDRLIPVSFSETLRVMSVGLLLENSLEPVIWRGPAKHAVISEFLSVVDWGELDYLVVDCPPGTGDEPLSVIKLLGDADGAVIVTTPQDLALADVRRSITFCRHLSLPVIGVIENMSGFACPHCGETSDIFKRGGGQRLAGEMKVPFLGRIPLDPALVEAGDNGKPHIDGYLDTPAARAMREIFAKVLDLIG